MGPCEFPAMSNSNDSLITVQQRPFNAETPLARLEGGRTPVELFYVRSNFDVPVGDGVDAPVVDADAWAVQIGGQSGGQSVGQIGGAIEQPRVVKLGELKRLPHVHVDATMECAGNGRKLMRPVPGGTPWGLGAVSTGRFTGVALRDVLALAGALGDDVVEIAFEAADEGVVENDDARGPVRFARSLPIERALAPDTLLAWALNDEPLTPAHGYPLRVFVPGWYGMASVKWVTRIEARTTPFEGHFQTERYVYVGDDTVPDHTPVTRMRVRALVTSQDVDGDVVRLRGVAWSGFGGIRDVAISDDGGTSWHAAHVTPGASIYAASRWTYEWSRNSGAAELLVRATDEAGNTQPISPLYNQLGYGNNVAQRVTASGW